MTPENERDAQTAGDDSAADETPRPAAGANGAAAADVAAGADPAGEAPTSDDAGDPPDPTVIDMASVIEGLEDGGTTSAEADPSAEEGAADGEGQLSMEEQLAASEAQAAAHWDRLVRLQAEMENQRKRAQRDVSNARKFALEGIAGDLLPVKDSLELGIQAASAEEASLANLLEGSELTLKMLAQVLEKHAIVEVNPEGEKFDPEFHQAMSMQEAEGVAPNTVTGVMQKGYTLNDRLIRPALVMVSK